MRNDVLDEVKQAGICSVCRNRNPVLSLFLTYHQQE